MFPPPSVEKSSSSRRSSFSSNAPNSPATHTRYARSPSPMPALPAIRMPTMPTNTWASVKLYGDESFTNFFRRLTFSPDGALLLTPAGQFEDPSVLPNPKAYEEQTRGRKGNPATLLETTSSTSTSSVYIYSRANFARPPIARLPGHKKASVAVKFSPILYELRPGVGATDGAEPATVTVDRGSDKSVDVDVAGPSPRPSQSPEVSTSSASASARLPTPSAMASPIVAPSPRVAIPPGPQGLMMPPSPALSATDSLRPMTPVPSKPATPAITPTSLTASVFALPYRMLYAVATMDTVAIHDTQQAGPVCLLTKLHYDEFTDMSWYVPFCHNFPEIAIFIFISMFLGRLMVNVCFCRRETATVLSPYSTRFSPRTIHSNKRSSCNPSHTITPSLSRTPASSRRYQRPRRLRWRCRSCRRLSSP